jgi:hypothetical protein
MKSGETVRQKPGPGAVLLQSAIPMAVGAFFYYKGKPVTAGILCGIGLVVLISGFLVPVAFYRIEAFGQWIGKIVGTALTWALLVPMFYLVFLPGRLILAARGIDPMCRACPTDASTYWVPRKPVGNAEEYKRQY